MPSRKRKLSAEHSFAELSTTNLSAKRGKQYKGKKNQLECGLPIFSFKDYYPVPNFKYIRNAEEVDGVIGRLHKG